MQPTPQNIQLLSKHRVLSFKPQLRLEWRGQNSQNETEQPDHSASLGDSITASTQIRFSVHTRDGQWKDCYVGGWARTSARSVRISRRSTRVPKRSPRTSGSATPTAGGVASCR